MEKNSPRQAALKKVLEDHPELAEAADSAELSRLNELVDSYEREIVTQREVEELRRREFAEQARQQGEEARRQREEVARLEAEAERARRSAAENERRLRLEQERAQSLAGAGPLRRFVLTHPWLVGAAAFLVIAAVVVGSIAISRISADNSARAAAEAQAAKVAQENAVQEEQARQEQERRAQLEAACDPSLPESELSQKVWMSWLACPDPAVAEQALSQVKSVPLDEGLLDRVATVTTSPVVAEFVSTRPTTSMRAHEVLVGNWGPETVGTSYAAVYGQECGRNRPEDYLAGTTWRAGDGAIFVLTERTAVNSFCVVEDEWPAKGWRGTVWWQQTGQMVLLQILVGSQSTLLFYELVDDELRLDRSSGPELVPEPPSTLLRDS